MAVSADQKSGCYPQDSRSISFTPDLVPITPSCYTDRHSPVARSRDAPTSSHRIEINMPPDTTTTTWILPLNAPDLSLANAGGKAVNLSALIRAGLSTPGGLVITTDAYDAFLASHHLDAAIADALASIDPAQPDSFAAASQAIRQRFAESALPPDLRTSILDAYARRFPGQEPVAVRSSATAEDLPDASFAGQQDTYLNVVGADALLDAVVRCWGSLWTDRAMAYRQRQHIPPEQVHLAVVVQPMIPADVAGVLFTVHPVTGNPDQMLINATWGLGEALVSGQVNPDAYVVDKVSGRVLSVALGGKERQTVTRNQSVTDAPMPEDRRQARTLTDAQAARLAELGRQVEALFGAPQDVEWAIAGERVHLLQARPVTTASAGPHVPGDDAWPPLVEKPPRPYDLWSQADLGERWPDPVTPLTWSTWKPITEESMGESFAGLKDPWIDEIEWTRRAYGRAYLNEGAMAYVLHRGYGMPATSFAEGMGSAPELVERYSGWKWGTALRRGPLMLGMMREWGRLIDKFEHDFPQIDLWVNEFMGRDLTSLPDQALWDEATDRWYPRLLEYLNSHAASTSQSMNAYTQMEGMLRRWLDDPAAIQGLVTGIDGVIQAEIAPSLWELAQAVRRQGLEGILLENDPETALELLADHPDAGPVLARLANFLERHGHRCAVEAEWLHPRWWERPALVMEQVASYLRAGDDFDPAQVLETQRAAQAEAVRTVTARLNVLQRPFFRRSLRRLLHLVRMRDNGQHYLVKLILPIRHIYAELAWRWADRGWLDEADDFFFLATEELREVLAHTTGVDETQTRPPLDLAVIARARREAWRHWMEQPTFPPLLDAAGDPVFLPTDSEDGGAIQGIGASRGQVTGRARVILSPSEASRIQPGDILVTRSTDPGWTPVFALIKGVVLEMGGQLSHGAIVAREYGLPAVVNAPGVTQRIPDGATITVDGATGQVWMVGTDSDRGS